jgi:peptidoglycan/xylan/chitin deacetylase (PgdA/CDA1 family)
MMWLALISTLTCEPAAPVPSSLTIAVHMTHGMSNAIAKDALREASAIWKLGGVTLDWHATSEPPGGGGRSSVNVTFDDAPGSVAGQDVPLGWVTLDAAGVPEGTIFLSRKNALRLADTIDEYRERPLKFKERLVARALGRALAHELGHYLTGSKEHSVSGLMKGRRLAHEFFSPACVGFNVNGDDRRLAARMLALAAANQCHAPVT